MTPSVIVSVGDAVGPWVRGERGRRRRRLGGDGAVGPGAAPAVVAARAGAGEQEPGRRRWSGVCAWNGPLGNEYGNRLHNVVLVRAMPDSCPWISPTGSSSTTSSPRSGSRPGLPGCPGGCPTARRGRRPSHCRRPSGTRVGSTGVRHELVPYAGPPTSSRQRVEWRVKVWTDLGESDWSDWSSWEVGLADPRDWSARWIGPHEARAGCRPVSGRPTSSVMSFTLDGAPVRARVYATAHGLYELFLNGSRVGDLELTPGTTAYRSQLDVQTYDVTDLLVPGDNVLGAVLSDGWWRGQERLHPRGGLLRDRPGAPRPARGRARGRQRGSPTAPDRAGRPPPGEIVTADLIDGRGRRPPPPSRRLGPGRLRRRGVGRGPRRRRVLRGAHDLAGAAGPPGRGAAAGVDRTPAVGPPRRRPRPEHQRVGPPGRPRPGRHRLDARPRRAPRRAGEVTTDHLQPVRLRHP